MASAQQASHSDDALALAQGNSQGSAQLPSAAISTPPFIKYFLATFASFSGLSAHAEQSRLASRTASDTTDVLEACGSHARQAQWRHIWELASASYLDRRHRVLLWRLLHGSLMCGAYKSYIGRATPAQANCPFLGWPFACVRLICWAVLSLLSG